MHDDDRIRILHMIDAAQAVEQFIRGKKREDLDVDRLLLFAVLRAIEVNGEAASKVTDETQAAMPSIPWASIMVTVAAAHEPAGSDPGAYVPSGGTGVPFIVRRSLKWDSVSLSVKYT